MKKAIALLSILLLGQIALTTFIYSPHDRASANPNLLAFDNGQVDTIRIEDDDKHQVTLKRQGGRWLVTDADNFPADDSAVTRLLSRLDKLKAGWPVATTTDAAQHFKVSDQAFVRRLTLEHGDRKLARLYLGRSPGIRKIYARADGHNDIHSVRFNAFDANARIDDWIDKHPLKVETSGISAIELPKLKLQREDKGLKLTDLKDGEQMNGDETAALAEYLADIPITGLADENTPTKTDDDLDFSLNIRDQGKRDYHFAKLEHGVDYLLTASNQKRRYRVSATTVDHIKSFSRDKLVALKGDDHTEASSNQNKGS